MRPEPHITFGMIVLNGEPFTRYNLRALYPFAHQIIVVEGACPSARNIATADGHSHDGTLECLRAFKEREDPEDKVVIVTAEEEGHPNGFWQNKNEMSKAYARRATGDYLWQVDSDEFYHEVQMKRMVALLAEQHPDAVSFPTIAFWGNPKYRVEGFYRIRDKGREFHRLFAWGDGYQYATHFPPTVVDSEGKDLRQKTWWPARTMERTGVYLFHYSLLFPKQVSDKTGYYKVRYQRNAFDQWRQTAYMSLLRPFHVHNVYRHISWLEKFTGEHPAAVLDMMRDIAAGRIHAVERDCRDVEELLSRRPYVLAGAILSLVAHLMATRPLYFLYRVQASLRSRLERLLMDAFPKRGLQSGTALARPANPVNEENVVQRDS